MEKLNVSGLITEKEDIPATEAPKAEVNHRKSHFSIGPASPEKTLKQKETKKDPDFVHQTGRYKNWNIVNGRR